MNVSLACPIQYKQFSLKSPVFLLILKAACFLKLNLVISYYIHMKNWEYFETKTFSHPNLTSSQVLD